MGMSNMGRYERKIEKIWNQGNLAVADKLIAEDFVDHYRDIRGRDGYKGLVAGFRQAFPDLEFEINHLYEVDDDTVVGHWTMTGTNEGPYFGKPPTGASVEMPGMDIVMFRDGKIVENYEVADELGLLEQLDGE
jgi:steroid delta-isomerase-like uncharacterized protein